MIRINIESIAFVDQIGKKFLLRDIAFTLAEHNIYTILGKNGEGKSTLLKSLTKLLDENVFSIKGEVQFEEVNLLSLPQNRLAEFRKAKIQYVFQDPVNSFDPLKKIGSYFGLYSFDENEIKKEFDFFNLPEPTKLFNLFPFEVSGGMAQRIAIVLALLKKPKFLLLDEPTSGIDSETILLVKKRLNNFALMENSVLLIITQDLSFAENMTDYIAYLENSKLSQFVSYKSFFNEESQSIINFLKASKQLNSNAVSNS